MRRLFLLVGAAAGIAACGAPSARDTATPDPKAPATDPAVIVVPSTVPKPAFPEAPKQTLIPVDRMAREVAVSQGYSLASATMILQDGRTLSQLYHADAQLKTPETTVLGNAAIVTHLMMLARDKSLRGFNRTSRRIDVLDDSTLSDSGSYVMVLKRSSADSVLERGQYTTRWRARQDITRWVMLEDHIMPGAAAKPKGRM
jgi:hypothetical protein